MDMIIHSQTTEKSVTRAVPQPATSGYNHIDVDEQGLAKIKEQFDILDIAQSLVYSELKSSNGDSYQPEDKRCPICGHTGFTVYSESQSFYCFSGSCGEHGDVLDLLVKTGQAKSVFDAANKLLRSELPRKGCSPVIRRPVSQPLKVQLNISAERLQKLFEAANEYYQYQLTQTPNRKDYLLIKRRLSKHLVQESELGYATGYLHRYLQAEGFSKTEMLASGLIKESKHGLRDLFPKDVYVFPHLDRNWKVSRFTFKDPKKEKLWQLGKVYWLNNVQFYGENTLELEGAVALVEGEHDKLALEDAGWSGPVLASIGTLSSQQLEWIVLHLKDRHVITFFDSDAAGDKYREKLSNLGLTNIIQVKIPETCGAKDIDEYLHSDNPISLNEFVSQYAIEVAPSSKQHSVNQQDSSSAKAQADSQNISLVDRTVEITPITTFVPTDFNDSRNADRLCALVGHDLRYVHQFGCFFNFNGLVWQPDESNQAMLLAQQVGKSIVAIGDKLAEEARAKDDETKLDFAKAVKAFGNRSLNRNPVSAMLEFAKPKLTLSASELDKDPMLLGVANGVINLNSGELRPSLRTDYITRSSTVTYDASANCPRWTQFIDEITCGDKQLAAFLQRCVGYWLTGRTDEQLLFFLYGHGCNGKSTFMSIVQQLIGRYGHQINSDVLLQSRFGTNSGPNPALAKLVGARLVVANELPEGARMDENLVKAMTGDDIIVARVPYAKTELEYRPCFSLVMIGNHKPVIRDTSPGMWRRMMLLPFNASFTKAQLDPQLMSKLQAELPGILNWAIKGTTSWLEHGLKASMPASLKVQVKNYQEESDLLGQFLSERVSTEKSSWISTDELYDAFKDWAKRDGEWTMTRNIMTKKLIEKGYVKGRKHNKACIMGISLQSAFDTINQKHPEEHKQHSVENSFTVTTADEQQLKFHV